MTLTPGTRLGVYDITAQTGATTDNPPAFSSSAGMYASSGYVLLGDGAGGVRASAWNPKTTALVLPETVVLENAHWTFGSERPWISAADNGTVVFVPGNPSRRHPVWVDRQGRSNDLPGEALCVTHTAVSRDGRRVSYGHGAALWVADIATGARTRILTDVNHVTGLWLPGDERMVISSNVSGDWDLYATK